MARDRTDHPPRDPEAPRLPPTLVAIDLEGELEHDAHYGGAQLGGAPEAGGIARGVTIEECRAEQLDLSNQRLPGLSLVDVELRGGSLSNADLRTSSWRRVSVVRARLTGTRWSSAIMDDVRFEGCQIDLAALTGCELRRVRFVDCRLVGSDLQELSAQDVAFVDCDLSETDLTGARFLRTEMHGCTIDGIRSIERLRGVGMRWNDIVASAGAFAAAVGVRLIDAD